MTLIQERRVYQPFEYPKAYDYWEKQEQSHWLHCVAGDQRVVTADGMLTVKELFDLKEELTLFNGSEIVTSSEMYKTGYRHVYRIHTKEGYTHTVTSDHRVMTANGWVEAQDLQPGDLLCIQTEQGLFGNIHQPETAYLLGHYQGDGTSSIDNKGRRGVYLDVWEKDYTLIPELETALAVVYNQSRLEDERYKIPDIVWKGDQETVAAYLRGLYTTNGSTYQSKKHESIKLTQVDLEYLREIQLLLANFGIKSSIYCTKAQNKLLPNGKSGQQLYNCQNSYTLEVTQHKSVAKLNQLTDIFAIQGKQYRGVSSPQKSHPITYAQFTHLEDMEEQDVYCVAVNSDYKAWVCNGFITHNTEIAMASCVDDWAHKLTEEEKRIIAGVLLGFTQTELYIGNYWGQRVSAWFPKPEIGMMAHCFAAFECFDSKTELLTSEGWVPCPEITMEHKVAQYNLDNKQVSFVNPLKVVNYDYKGIMHYYRSKNTNICVTPNHDLITIHRKTGKTDKQPSYQSRLEGNYKYPTSGLKTGVNELTALERVLIATQADGCLHELCPSTEDRNSRSVDIKLTEERKIARLSQLLDDSGIAYTKQSGEEGQQAFHFRLPDEVDVSQVKSLGFLNLEEMSSGKAREIIAETLLWNANEERYYSTNKEVADKVQAIACLSDYYTITLGHDYALNVSYELVNRIYPQRIEVDYEGKVYCVSVPTQNLVSRRNGRVAFTGNTIHTKAYNYLNETLGLEEYDAFLQEPAAAAKLDNLVNRSSNTLYDKALSLAVYSGLGEGVSLYSSFAILLHFSTRNLLKGVGEIITYSVRDECHSPDTEVLTSKGWVRFDLLKGNEELAQFDMQTREVSFTKPSRLVVKQYSGKMIKFGGEKMALRANVTENHDMVYRYDYTSTYSKRPAKEIKVNPKMVVPISGYKTEGAKKHLSAIERFYIALQADGTLNERYDGSRCSTVSVWFSFSKQRKIDRLISIIEELGFTYSTSNAERSGNTKNLTVFRVNVPIEYPLSKTFDWVNLEEVTAQWAVEFAEELQYWDGHISKDAKYIYYSSVKPENLDIIQAVCALGGLSATWTVQTDDRSESYKDEQRLYIHRRDTKRLDCLTKEVYDYDGLVYCATVEKGTLITRYEKSVSISGNCIHSQAGCWLFRTLVEENPELRNTNLFENITQAARLTVQLEFDFIDMVFNQHNMPGLSASNVKAFIEHRANNRLEELGLKPIFAPEIQKVKNVSDWFYLMTAGEQSTDFFAARVTNYAKGTFNPDNINWNAIFAEA